MQTSKAGAFNVLKQQLQQLLRAQISATNDLQQKNLTFDFRGGRSRGHKTTRPGRRPSSVSFMDMWESLLIFAARFLARRARRNLEFSKCMIIVHGLQFCHFLVPPVLEIRVLDDVHTRKVAAIHSKRHCVSQITLSA